MTEIEDKDLGKIVLKTNARAKRIIARVRDGVVVLTHPRYVSKKEIVAAVEAMKPSLLGMLQRVVPCQQFSTETELQTLSFIVKIRESKLVKSYAQLEGGVLNISVPQDTDFEEEHIQNYIRQVIESALRSEAHRIFPLKLKQLAEDNDFTYTQLKINKSKTRWGSCSSRKSINLSYYCLLLPEYLLDFIILHELCHTIEMNHGEHFWALLDKVSLGKAEAYTHELKNYRTSF